MVWRRIRFLLELSIVLMLTIGGLELFMRSSGACQPAAVVCDDRFGSVMKPNTNVVFVNEGFRIGRINEYGYLGPAYPPEKDEGTVRIALMGDSYVAGRELYDRHHFRHILEEELNSMSSRPVEVLNLGYPTSSLERFYIYYEVFGKQLSPDYVLFFVGRTSLNWNRHEIRPELVAEGDSLRIDYSFRSSREYAERKKTQCLRELSLCSLVKKVRELCARGEFPHIILGKLCGSPGLRTAGEDAEEPVRAGNPDMEAINRAIVEELGEVNRAGCQKPIIVSRDSLPESFIELVRDNGITYFDASAKLDSLSQAGIDPRYWEGSRRRGHWNHNAHRVIGTFLAEKMQPLIETH